ncbi:uncharacterized protein [Prorops nasuta]|uniref:uncharacterized protein n=1 Tax=Prorops nasuta TaxID=863751 RepID=UPI0034CDE68B
MTSSQRTHLSHTIWYSLFSIVSRKTPPTFKELVEFLEGTIVALSSVTVNSTSDKTFSSEGRHVQSKHKPTVKVHHAELHSNKHFKNPSSLKCPICSAFHYVGRCEKFRALSAPERRNEVRRIGVCFNCFGKHMLKNCQSKHVCNKCQGRHHTLLHVDTPSQNVIDDRTSTLTVQAEPGTSAWQRQIGSLRAHSTLTVSQSLLPTTQVFAVNIDGLKLKVRALLDQASKVTFISESLAQSPSLTRQRVCIPVVGVGASKGVTARSSVTFRIQSIVEDSFVLVAHAFVLPKLTSLLPSEHLLIADSAVLDSLSLADNRFNMPGEINIILGVDVYTAVIRQGLLRIHNHDLIAQNTSLGWILSGVFNSQLPSSANLNRNIVKVSALHTIEEDMGEILNKFWHIEDIPDLRCKLSPDELLCESIFVNTHYRRPDGRYVVTLPLRCEIPDVAEETRRLALNLFHSLLRRFDRDPEVASEYRKFMKEYQELGHMRLFRGEKMTTVRSWYLPHHAVYRRESKGIRVVFDASRRTADQHCLNNFILAGPSLQKDLSLILLGWRKHRFVFTADIASAPFLAIRTLQQLAIDRGTTFPLGAFCLNHHTYVDDIFTGADTLAETCEIRDQLIGILNEAGIQLDKWAANNSEILAGSNVSISASNTDTSILLDTAVKTLGLLWQPLANFFYFNTQISYSSSQATTKRSILSCLARLFDPLGWLAPVVVRAKLLMQDLWIQKIDWDTPLPSDIVTRWQGYCSDLSRVSEIKVSRWLGELHTSNYELHGFADASMRAYAAVIFLRVPDSKGGARVSLLLAKTKVTPVKTITIPRLELCGAVLLVRLFKHLRKLEFFKDIPITAWLDNRDALAWIRKHPSQWKVFVANRVSYIQTELPSATWKYVSTYDNPADAASRGLDPISLKNSDIWWQGPKWLQCSKDNWPEQPITTNPVEPQVQVFTVLRGNEEDTLLSRFSSLSKLLRIVAYCYRFIDNCRRRKLELFCLRAKKPLLRRIQLLKLHPFLDENGIIRVGGRLIHSALSFTEKHPPILPKRSNLSLLFVRHAHRLSLHGGPTLTLSILIQQVWVTGARNLVKRHIRACIRCCRAQPRLSTQIMGNLPSLRVRPSRTFSTTGLDYAGPFWLKMSKGRGQKYCKGYIALFICFCTKAIHLEAISDMSTQAFIAAFLRFVSRRGLSNKIYSDNGSNFQGASKELQQLFRASSEFYLEAADQLSALGTSWSFIPPNSPHFGGLLEAGVRATKHHLLRVIGEHRLTFEKFSTVLAEIEACLNSRPLYPISGDIDDLSVLTPAHFLTGATTNLLPDLPCTDVADNRLSRYQMLTKIQQCFRKRWVKEYLHHLQERNKWRGPAQNFAVGQQVIVQDDRYPSSKWPIGRIMETHPGKDGLVRVVTIKTASSILKRPIVRLSPLPICIEDNEGSKAGG